MQHRHSYEVIRPYAPGSDTNPNVNGNKNGAVVATAGHSDDLYSNMLQSVGPRNQYDCGLRMIFCKNLKCSVLQRYAIIQNFCFVLCLIIFFHSAIRETFIQIVIETNYYNISLQITEWLVLWEGGMQILFAMVIGYMGARSHRPSWIAILCLLQSIILFALTTSTTAIFDYPTKNFTRTDHSGLSLCEYGKYRETNPKWISSWTLFGILFGFQTANALVGTSIVTLGLTYMDDNALSLHTPVLLGIAIAVKYFGVQLARFVLWFKKESDLYRSDDIIWYILGVPFFMLSLVIVLFPYKYTHSHHLPSRTPSHRIVRSSIYRTDHQGIYAKLRRIFEDKLILFTVLGIASIHTVIVNCSTIEYDYFKSVFFVDDYSESSIISLIRLPVICLCVVITGYMLYIVRPKASRLLACNVIILCLIIIMSFFSMFLRCNESYLHNEVIDRKVLLEYCNQNCQCLSTQRFSPVCAQGSSVIFYSPCHAGCREAYVDLEFWKCTCVPTQTVSAANCKNESCESKVAIFQLLIIISVSLLACTTVMNLLLLLRIVNKEDRALVLGLQLTASSIFIYLPGKFFYSLIIHETCILNEPDGCKMNHGVQFSTFISLLNICFFTLACGLLSLAWVSIQNVNLFPKPEPKNRRPELQGLHYSNTNLVNGGRRSLLTRSSSISALPLSDHNPFKKDAIREFNEIQKQYAAKSEADLHSTLRQNHFDGSKGITIRKDGILTTIL